MRGCACQGNQGFAHVSCLVRQARTMTEDRAEQKGRLENGQLHAITSCKLCKKHYNADVLVALGWGCWKLYATKPETPMYGEAMVNLAICFGRAGREAEAVQVSDALDQETKRLDARKQEHLARKAEIESAQRSGGYVPKVESKKEHLDRYY